MITNACLNLLSKLRDGENEKLGRIRILVKFTFNITVFVLWKGWKRIGRIVQAKIFTSLRMGDPGESSQWESLSFLHDFLTSLTQRSQDQQ